MTFDLVKGHMKYAGCVIDHCDEVSLKSVKAARRNKAIWLTEERRTSEKQNTGALHAPM